MTGDQSVILEYDEPHNAKHDGNYWDEQSPSVALDRPNNALLYAADPDLMALTWSPATSPHSSTVSRVALRWR
jgi:hypothetical protein